MRLTFCTLCGESRPGTLEHHHFIPKVMGGTDDEDNMFTVCGKCHGKIHAIPRPLFLSELVKEGRIISEQRSFMEKRGSIIKDYDRLSSTLEKLYTKEDERIYNQEQPSKKEEVEIPIIPKIETLKKEVDGHKPYLPSPSPGSMINAWVKDTSNGWVMTRIPTPPPPLIPEKEEIQIVKESQVVEELKGKKMPKLRPPPIKKEAKEKKPYHRLLVRDTKYPNMWRVRLPDNSLSDMYNITRANSIARYASW